MGNSSFLLGEWHVAPATNSLIKGKIHRVVEPKAMDVLLFLCQPPGKVFSPQDIVNACWPNLVLGDNPLHKSITQLRKALDDKASSPQYIETIRKRGYRIIAEVEVENKTLTDSSEKIWKQGSPYAGLKAFSASQASIFFGRDRQINQLLESLTQQVKYDTAFTLILGASGSGKTSLVQAGLIPRLLNKNHVSGISVVSEVLFDCGDADAGNLWLDFASYLLDWEIDGRLVFSDMSPADIAYKLQHHADELIVKCTSQIQAYSDAKDILYPRLFLTIDRLEVLLDSPSYSKATRDVFINLIDSLARSRAIIVVANCRNDFYPLIASYPKLMQNKDKGVHFDLTAPQATDVIQIIRLPAIAAGLTWEYDESTHISLDERIANDANNTPDALPLLQYSLNEIYDQRQGSTLTFSSYQKLGGLEGAIGNKAENLVMKFSETDQHALESLFAKLITLNQDGTNLTSKSVAWEELTTDSQRNVAQILVDNRLFVSDLELTKPSFRLAHEALIRRWARIQKWVEAHKHSLMVSAKVTLATDNWLSENRNSAYLLTKGKPLEEALDLSTTPSIVLTDNEKAFIQASTNKAGKQQRIRRITLSTLAVLALLSCVLTAFSFNALNVAENKRSEAEDLLGFMVGEFADKLRSVKRLDLLDGINQKATQYFTEQSENEGVLSWFTSKQQFFDAQFKKAQTLQSIAEVDYSRGRDSDAKLGLIEAEKIFNSLYKEKPDHFTLLKIMGANAFWQGMVDYDNDKLDSAELFWNTYLSFSNEMLALSPEDEDALIEVSDAQSSLGSLYFQKQEYDQANSAFTESLSAITSLLTNSPDDPFLLSEKAHLYSWLAEVQVNIGKLKSAITLYQQGLSYLERVEKSAPNDADILVALQTSYRTLAAYSQQLQKSNQASVYSQYAIETLDKLIQRDPANTLWNVQRREMEALQLLIIATNSTSDKALSNDSSASDIINQAIKYSLKNISTLLIMVEYFQITNDWEQSKSTLEHLEESILKLENLNVRRPKSTHSLANYYLLTAKYLHKNNELNKQVEYCNKAINVLKPLLETNQHLSNLRLNVKAHECTNTQYLAKKHISILANMGITNYHFFSDKITKGN